MHPLLALAAATVAVPIPTSPSKYDTPLELTSNIGTPDISATANMLPLRSSVTENNWPCVPCMSNLAKGVDVPIPTLPLDLTINFSVGVPVKVGLVNMLKSPPPVPSSLMS